ncbi:hypothetical protein [Prevotella sp. E13-27]|uniref:hypothetical protein n=1 Tax=Prevotella sp. E13-27 TaxID=2938122 RepID=UPI00200A71EA|nr:hypothetical protein [Prevotella sp. E13-27]MCK8620823.1 hypothetical protein [Prevotella sp. E13-27]
MKKFKTTFKGLLLAAVMMLGVSSAWGQAVTRTWDFTASGWSTISKPAEATVYYYATTGTTSASNETAYNSSEAVAIHATNAFTYTASQGYSFGTKSTTVTDNVPSHDYFSVVVPAGYTLKVTGQLTYNNNYSSCFNISAGTTFRYQYNAAVNSLQDGIYTNCTNAPVTAYIYNTATADRPLQIRKIILTNTLATSLTAVSEYTKWDFTNRPYAATYDGMIVDNIYLGSGIKQVSNSYVYLPTALASTPTAAGANMVSFKAGVAGRVIMKLQYYSQMTLKVSDGSSEVASFSGDNTASYGSENMAAFDVEAGKQYFIYAISVNNDKKAPGFKTIEFYPKGNTTVAITGNTSWDFTTPTMSVNYNGITKDNIYYGSGVAQIRNGYIDLNGEGNTSTGAGTVQFKIPADKAIGLLIKATASNNRPSVLTDGTNTLQNFNASNGSKDVTISLSASKSERTMYYYCTSYTNNYGRINYIHVYTQQSVSIGSTGWATLYTPCALDFSGVKGLTAYTATCESSTVTLTKVNNVPAGTGVILKGTPNTNYDIPAAGSSSTDKGHLTGAFFTATAYDAFTDPAYTIYALTSENGGATVQFNPITSGEIAAGKAFLKISDGASALGRSMNVVFADETTGIKNLTPTLSEGEKVVYNLQGRRVTQPTKGIYVHNGKKVIIK